MTYYTGTSITYTAVPETPGYQASDHTVDWYFSDNTQQTGASVQKTWSSAGDKTATATATNNITGGSGYQDKTIPVVTLPPISSRPFLERGTSINRTFWETNVGVYAKVANAYYIPVPVKMTTDGLTYTTVGTGITGRGTTGRLAVSSNGQNIVAGATSTYEYAVTHNGGATWSIKDMNSQYFSMGPIVCSPDGATVIAVASNGGTWHTFIARSTNGGDTFPANGSFGGFNGGPWFFPIDQFACGPLIASSNFNMILSCGRVMLTSVDRGLTWSEGPATPFQTAYNFMAGCVCGSDNLSRVYATFEANIYLSTNYGLNWTIVKNFPGGIYDISCTWDGMTLIASVYTPSGQQVQKSIDGGVNWTVIGTGINAGQNSYITRDGTRIFTNRTQSPNAYKPMVSDDGGLTWK